MRRRLSVVWIGIASFMMFLSSDLSAQTVKPVAETTKAKAKSEVAVNKEKVRMRGDARKVSPRVMPEIRKVAENTVLKNYKPFTTFTPSLLNRSRIPAMAAGDGTLIYGDVIFADSWTEENAPAGIYSFPASSNTTLEAVAIDDALQANGGAVYVNGKYHFTYYMEFFGMIFANYYVYNAETWEVETEAESDATSIAMDLTYDPTTDAVYGCFFNDNIDGYVLGTMNLETGARTAIGDLSTGMYVMAANSKGDLYGIGTDGILYRIDKTTATATSIGATGVSPKYIQSGSFDMKSGKLYWAACRADGTAGLYDVDTATGSASLVSELPNNEEIVGMYIPAPAAEDGAPAAVEDLTATFTNGATTGNVKFTMPSKTFGGSELTGSLTYSITFNNEEKATGSANAGTMVEKNVTVGSGMFVIAATASNSVGKSPVSKVNLWIGNDAPKAVGNVNLEKGDAPNKLVLTWTAPTEGIHSGYLDPATLKYKIVRYPDQNVVGNMITATTFTETLTVAELSNFWYEITAYSNDLEGETVASNKVALGSSFTVPYFEGFVNAADFGLFTVIDANNDGDTWSYDSKTKSAKCAFSSDNQMDDWLITPPIRLNSDRVYKIYFRTAASSAKFPERLKVALGSDKTVEAMTTEVLPATVVNSTAYITFEKIIRVSEAKDYYIGFQSCSDPDMFNLFVDSIGVEEGGLLGAPGAATELKVVPAGGGVLNATISFKTPAKTIDDATLTSLTKVDLYRENTLIKTFDNPGVGVALTYTDDHAQQGDNVYKVVASNADGEGLPATATAYVGVDIPSVPVNIVLKEVDGKAVLTWEAPTTGATGGFINPAGLVYYVMRATDQEIVAEAIPELTFTDTPDLSAGQDLMAYYVFAESVAGLGKGMISNTIVMGNPYSLPFTESFADAKLDNGPWGVVGGLWALYTEGKNPVAAAQDGDGGFASFSPKVAGAESLLYSGKINLAGSKNPMLTFYYYFVTGSTDKLNIQVAKEGGAFATVQTVDLATNSGAEGWTKVSVPLTDYISAKYIQLGFDAVAGAATNNLHLDNIKVADALDYNLAVTGFSAPNKMKVGLGQELKATVTNEGLKKATGYTVELYRDGMKTASIDGEDLEPENVKTYTFTETPDLNFKEQVTYYVSVNYAADLNQANNKSEEVTVTVLQPTYPTVSDLTGNGSDGKAILTWSQPDLGSGTAQPVTDDVEDYDAFIIDAIGEWTLVDQDGSETYGISDGAGGIIQYDNAGAAMAFQVFNPAAAGISSEIWAPNSGSQMFASFAATDGQNDDWLISPELSGAAQTLSFYVKSVTDDYGLESYEVQISSTDKEIASFRNISDAEVILEAPIEWTKVTFDLPAGTKYFAIRCTSPDRFALLVDDITYLPASAAPEDLELKGYNVYRDNEKITSTPVATATYTDPVANPGEYKYKVTVMYDKGESAYSNEITVNVTSSIDEVLSGVNVRGIRHAIEIRNAAGKEIYICTIDGKLVYEGVGQDVTKVPLADGKYAVKVGDNKAVKVLVK